MHRVEYAIVARVFGLKCIVCQMTCPNGKIYVVKESKQTENGKRETGRNRDRERERERETKSVSECKPQHREKENKNIRKNKKLIIITMM